MSADLGSSNPYLGVYRRVFGTAEGVIVLADLMDFVGLWNNSFYPDSRRAERVMGQRDLLMYILERLGISTDPMAISRALMAIPVPQPEDKQEEAES
jgi:hypothetical protein